MAVCHCDMFPDPHDDTLVIDNGDGTWTECETVLRQRGPLVSPHLFPYARFANDPWGYRNDSVE